MTENVKLNGIMSLENVVRWGLRFTPSHTNKSFKFKTVSRKTFKLPSNKSQGHNSERVMFDIFLNLCLILHVSFQKY